MKIYTILLAALMTLVNFSVFECDAQTSRLPAEMPEKTEFRFTEGGGMLNAYLKISIKGQTISVEEKKANEREARKWTAEIEKSEQENLYRVFVENKFDTIKNDERKGIVYDAGSESVFINLGNGKSFGITYGKNSPLSGANLKRFQAAANAIQDLRLRYEKKAQTSDDAEFAVFEYSPENYNRLFKNARPANLSGDEIRELKSLLKRAVDEHNARQKDPSATIRLDEYKFQFVPVLNETGEKEVWTNCFCADFRQDWRKTLIEVDDGGKCFFNLYINLNRKSYDRFSVNGVA